MELFQTRYISQLFCGLNYDDITGQPSKCRKHVYLTSSLSVDPPPLFFFFFPYPPSPPPPEPGKKTTQKTRKKASACFSLLFLDGCHLCDCLVHANLISLRFTYTAEAPHYVRGVILELRFINQNSNYCIITNPSLSHLTQSI